MLLHTVLHLALFRKKSAHFHIDFFPRTLFQGSNRCTLFSMVNLLLSNFFRTTLYRTGAFFCETLGVPATTFSAPWNLIFWKKWWWRSFSLPTFFGSQSVLNTIGYPYDLLRPEAKLLWTKKFISFFHIPKFMENAKSSNLRDTLRTWTRLFLAISKPKFYWYSFRISQKVN